MANVRDRGAGGTEMADRYALDMSESPRIFSRLLNGGVCVYDPAGSAQGVLDPVMVFPVRPEDEVVDHTASTDISRVVYTTKNAVACVTSGGNELWRYDLEPLSTKEHGHIPSCEFSADGDGLNLFAYPWGDRALIDLAADGKQFMTINDDQSDVTFHAYPGGETSLRLTIEAFGYESEDWSDAHVEWSSGYLDSETAIVTICGEGDDEKEWWHHYRVDIRTGEIGSRLDEHWQTSCAIEPAGDDSWLTTDADGRPVRWLNG
jgi:hypothetical protein